MHCSRLRLSWFSATRIPFASNAARTSGTRRRRTSRQYTCVYARRKGLWMNRPFRLLLSVFLLSLLAVGGVLSAARADLSTLRHTERAGRFSYYPPKGWRVAEMGGLKYRVVVGPPDGDFAPNLNVVDQKSKLSLREFAAASKQS